MVNIHILHSGKRKFLRRGLLFFIGIWLIFEGKAGHGLCAQEDEGLTLELQQDQVQTASHADSTKMDSLQWADFQAYIPTRENKSFAVGESFHFDIAYQFIRAGSATMSIPDTQWVHERPCYHVVTTARSSKFFDNFFKVRDRIESYIDMQGLFPWKFEKHIREGKHQSDKYIEYDQVNQRVIYNHKDTLAVTPLVQGIISSFYYVRTVPLEVGKSVRLDGYNDKKLYPLQVLVHKKDRVKVPAGTFDCIVVEPVIHGEGIFNQKGRLTIWLTDDERRIPVLMKSKISVGSIDVRLRSIQNLPK